MFSNMDVPGILKSEPSSEIKQEDIKKKAVTSKLLFSDLHWDRCVKHPGHSQFIPISNFKLELLPEAYRSNMLYQFVHEIADLTVRLRVKYVSMSRPSGYVFSELRGKHVTHTGTGFVFRINDTEDNIESCTCMECQKSGVFPSTTVLFIKTAAHVIFDDEEARNTLIDITFIDENNQQFSSTLFGGSVSYVNIESDISEITCATHDQTVCNRLRNNLLKYEELQRKVGQLHGTSDSCTCKSHVHGKSVNGGIGKEAHYSADVTHHQRHDTRNEKTVDDDVDSELSSNRFFRATDVVRSVKHKDSLQADGSEESELENVEVMVCFPDGEVSTHNIWMFHEPVKYSKVFLLNQGGIKNVSPDQLVMVLHRPGKSDIVMDDEKDMMCYLSDLLEVDCIKFAYKD